jgi:hypothetical protein
MTDHEQTIAMAAWLRGLAVGIAALANKTFYRKVKKSWLAGEEGAQIFATAEQILNGGAFNPLSTYEMTDAAKRLGWGQPHSRTIELIHEALYGE